MRKYSQLNVRRTATVACAALGLFTTQVFTQTSNPQGDFVIEEPDGRSCWGMVATVVCGGGDCWGTDGDDVIVGTAGADTIHALRGDDVVCALGGNDTVYGDEGDDYLFAHEGSDTVSGGPGKDFINGGEGSDALLSGGPDGDVIYGEGGNDLIWGDSLIEGPTDGDDIVHGGEGQDWI
jgi:Ca2+-binding RTX toxin-like protein